MKAHPFVFSKRFTELPLREQKLFLSLYIQQGVTPEKSSPTFRCFMPTKSEHIEYGDVTLFLHANTTYVRRSIQRLASEAIFGDEPLFTKVYFLKEHKNFSKVFIQVNPNLHIHPIGEECHDPIRPRLSYKRKSSLLERLLEDVGLGDLIAYQEGIEFAKLVRLLRNASLSVMKYVVRIIHEKITMREAYPNHVVPLVHEAVQNHSKVKMLALAEQHGLSRLITVGLDAAEGEKRKNEFAAAFSHMNERHARKLFEAMAPSLKERFMIPLSRRSLNYHYDNRLDWIKGIDAVRYQAKRLYKDPESYLQLELTYGNRYLGLQRKFQSETIVFHREVRNLLEDILQEIDKLPTVILIPSVGQDFKLEDVMLRSVSRGA